MSDRVNEADRSGRISIENFAQAGGRINVMIRNTQLPKLFELEQQILQFISFDIVGKPSDLKGQDQKNWKTGGVRRHSGKVP